MKSADSLSGLAELKSILAEVGSAGIWRPVYDHRGQLLAGGVGDPADGLSDELPGRLFRGRRVVDIGCNFGAFSFMAARKGAGHVCGVDIDERIVRGCRILKQLLGYDNIDFMAADLRHLNTDRPFDLGMMIDFIGKTVIRDGFLTTCLDVIEAVSKHQMLFSVRPVYSISRHFDGDRRGLLAHYPADIAAPDHFLLLDYLEKRFRGSWQMRLLSARAEDFNDKKQTVLFSRR